MPEHRLFFNYTFRTLLFSVSFHSFSVTQPAFYFVVAGSALRRRFDSSDFGHQKYSISFSIAMQAASVSHAGHPQQEVKYWNRLPRMVVDAPGLSVFRRHFDSALNNML